MRKNFFLLLIVATITATSLPVSAADKSVELIAPFSNVSNLYGEIPEGYFQAVELDSKTLFEYPAASRHDLVLPHLGRIGVIHDLTRTADLSGKLTKWEGHIEGHQTLKVTFVKGISGMVTGVIDTPAGRVLLGQAGDYIVYKQSRVMPTLQSGTKSDTPEALLDDSVNKQDLLGIKKPAAVSYPIDVNVPALSQAPINSEVDVSLPGAGDFRVVHDNTLAGDLGGTTFVGYLKEFGDDYRMVVTYSPSGAEGQILTPYGVYLIKTIDHQQWLVDVNGSGLQHVVPIENDGMGQHDESSVLSSAGEEVQSVVANGVATTADSTTDSVALGAVAGSDKTRIDVLVLYSPGFEDSYGGTEQALTRLQFLVALANLAYIDSGVAIQLRLVGAMKVDAPDYSSNLDALNAITKGSSPYNNVSWLRYAYGADLVSLVRPFSMAQGGLCGISWVGGSNGTSISRYRDQGFSVVSDGREGGYYCSAYTFAHELGHNMGNVHDRATVAHQGGNQGAYPYSFGYGIGGQFGTIMSYIDPEVGKFSNPDKMCKGLTACGVSESDLSNAANNALSLNNTRSAVAAFMPEASAEDQMISIAGVVTMDGKALSGVEIATSASSSCTNTGDNGSFSCIVASDWSGTITPRLSGYTFSPESLTLNNLSSNTPDQDFTAMPNQNLSLTASGGASADSGGGGAMGFESLFMAVLFVGFKLSRHS